MCSCAEEDDGLMGVSLARVGKVGVLGNGGGVVSIENSF